MENGIEVGIDSVILFTTTFQPRGMVTMVSEGTYTDRSLVTAVYVAGFVERLVGGRLVDAGLWSKQTIGHVVISKFKGRIEP
jgi:hypothetical protein